MVEGEANRFQLVSIAQIHLSYPEQPRHHLESKALENLATSILQHGIMHPLLVRPLSSAIAKYELVTGEQQFHAALLAGLDAVPVVIRELSDLEAATLTSVENLQRQDLDAIEETRGIVRLIALHLQLTDEATVSLLVRMAKEVKGQTAQNILDSPTVEIAIDMFSFLGKMSWETFVTCRLPLLNLPPDLQLAIQTEALNHTKALALSRLKDDELRSLLLQQVLKQNLPVRQIHSRIRQLQHLNLLNQPRDRLSNQNRKHSQTNSMASLAVCGELGEDNNTPVNKTENRCRGIVNESGTAKSLIGIEAESSLIQFPSLIRTTQLDQTTGDRADEAFNNTYPQSSQHDIEELPFQKALHVQIAIFTQIETISRQIRESLASSRRVLCTPKQQRRLLLLLDQLQQILEEEY